MALRPCLTEGCGLLCPGARCIAHEDEHQRRAGGGLARRAVAVGGAVVPPWGVEIAGSESGHAHSLCVPRWATRRTDRPSFGPAIAAVAERLGLPLMPWQRLVADVGGELDPATGLPAYREVIVTVPRQSGNNGQGQAA